MADPIKVDLKTLATTEDAPKGYLYLANGTTAVVSVGASAATASLSKVYFAGISGVTALTLVVHRLCAAASEFCGNCE